ncbi:MAG TPA: isocitrate lyase/PEP mutase family protein [Myxococcales bacterium]|nr:isocitrate lyase/PEP mutase family protein [Myxococcales bacterium]
MLLQKNRPLVLPAAHDALTARMIEAAGFPAYQIGGFALVGARYGQPDIDLIHLGERRAAVRDIMTGSSLPVLVDLDDGYGDAKNVTFAVRCMEAIRVSAIFIEDQQAPKKCGQMDDKHVIEPDEMVAKIRAAVEARSSPGAMFVVARTDALEAEGMRKALKRGERYLEAGADALYVEGPRSDDELREVASAFPGALLVTTMMEGGGETPWHPPAEFGEMGYSMILYPTSIIFRAARAMQKAVADLRAGRRLDPNESMTKDEFMKLVGLEYWQGVEKKFHP